MKFLKKNPHSFTITSENTSVDIFCILEISKVGFSAYPLQKISSVYSIQIGKAPTILKLCHVKLFGETARVVSRTFFFLFSFFLVHVRLLCSFFAFFIFVQL